MDNLVKNENEVTRKCCFTGYRPSKFPFSLDREDEAYKEFEDALVEQILELSAGDCKIFYSGMAMGFDIIAAETVLKLKNAYSTPLKLVCVLPFEAQGDSFTGYWKKRFYDVIEQCDEMIVLSEEYFAGCYQKRNEFMVDNCDYVVTWYDGQTGGTKNTIDYANYLHRKVFNINEKPVENIAVQTQFELL